VPLWNTPLNYLEEMIGSVQAQTYQNWELCLADGSDQEHNEVEERCQAYAKDDPRIVYKRLAKNEGIAGNTNQCFAMATGEYIGLFDHDDVLHPSALYEYIKVINEQGADYIYCDETTFKGDSINNMITLHFKPDFAIDNLRANNYICHFSVFSRELLEGTELFRSGFDGSQDHDMILRLTANAKKVVHVPKLLYYWRSHKNSTASDISAKPYAIAAAKGAVADHLAKCGFRNFEIKSTRAFDTIFEIKYEILKEDKISILIPNKDHVEDLRRCITSIQERSTYDNYEIIIIENNSTENATLDYYKTLENQDKISVVKYQGDFNYAKINNFGAGYAKGAYLLLLNNDTQIISMNWLEAMLMYAQRPDVGAVGAKLYYADRTIQHAGVVIGLGAHRTAGHTHYKINYDNLGYMGKLCYAQDVSAVTGACLMVKKELFEAADGLDESFRIALNDVDFCLRLREMGYLNVFTPFAELYHFESASRGSDMVDAAKAKRYEEESQYFREKWKTVLEKGDPYYNPNFSLDYSDYSLRTVPVEKQKIKS
jgi:GT2 family glycosyltransferase